MSLFIFCFVRKGDVHIDRSRFRPGCRVGILRGCFLSIRAYFGIMWLVCRRSEYLSDAVNAKRGALMQVVAVAVITPVQDDGNHFSSALTQENAASPACRSRAWPNASDLRCSHCPGGIVYRRGRIPLCIHNGRGRWLSGSLGETKKPHRNSSQFDGKS